jgi:hypothetical protein
VKSQPISVNKAAPLPRAEQDSLIRFLAGRETRSAGQENWSGAFAPLESRPSAAFEEE